MANLVNSLNRELENREYRGPTVFRVFDLTPEKWSKYKPLPQTGDDTWNCEYAGVDFTNILLAAFTCADPKSAKRQSSQ